jgi:hypothetical protein
VKYSLLYYCIIFPTPEQFKAKVKYYTAMMMMMMMMMMIKIMTATPIITARTV